MSSTMQIGVNLEYVRHADKSLTYGVKRAAEIGYKYVEPCVATGYDLLSLGGYWLSVACQIGLRRWVMHFT